MKISDAFLKIQIGANLTPDLPNYSGSYHVGRSSEKYRTKATGIFGARFSFSALGQIATIYPTSGVVSLSVTGAAQVCTKEVGIVDLVTASGNLIVTVTSTKVVGSPLALTVPLSAGQTTAQVIAAILAKFAATPAITNFFEMSSVENSVQLTSLFGYANDTTLNISITTGLGVFEGGSSQVAGVLGILQTRVDGGGVGGILDMVVSAQAPGTGSVTGAGFSAPLLAGMTGGLSYATPNTAPQAFTSNGPCIIDVVATQGLA